MCTVILGQVTRLQGGLNRLRDTEMGVYGVQYQY
jgi:hypothetical protein